MVEQIDKYWEKLFAAPMPVLTPNGVITAQPQRTNNILKRFFRDEKRRGRKKTGMSSLNKMLKAVLADTPLVQNLKNDEYLAIILNGCPKPGRKIFTNRCASGTKGIGESDKEK